jgi:hypothetical protein
MSAHYLNSGMAFNSSWSRYTQVVRIPTTTGGGCGGGRGGSYGTRGGRLVPSGAELVAGAFAGADVVEAVVEITGGQPTSAIEGDCHIVLAQAENATDT